jgi:hypothetical protein
VIENGSSAGEQVCVYCTQTCTPTYGGGYSCRTVCY